MSEAIHIPVGKYHALIDTSDAPLVNQYNWSPMETRGLIYALASKSGRDKNLYMHRLIMGEPDGKSVDHINRNPLDNRRRNLRVVGQRKNIANAGEFSHNTSGYRGVTKFRNGWRAQTKYRNNGFHYHVSTKSYKTPIEAALVRDEMMRLIHGKIVFENFPGIKPPKYAKDEANRVVSRLWERIEIKTAKAA